MDSAQKKNPLWTKSIQFFILFLPTVPGGGTVGQQMDFFFSSSFFSSFSSFSSFTPPNWPKRGVKKTWPKRGVKKQNSVQGIGGVVTGGGGGIGGAPYKKNGGPKTKQTKNKKNYSVQGVGGAAMGGGGYRGGPLQKNGGKKKIKKILFLHTSIFWMQRQSVHVYWGGGGVMVL